MSAKAAMRAQSRANEESCAFPRREDINALSPAWTAEGCRLHSEYRRTGQEKHLHAYLRHVGAMQIHAMGLRRMQAKGQ